MQDRPNADELIAAVQHFLEEEILPLQKDQRVRFRTRVAAHVLTIVQRELRAGSAPIEQEAERLRALLQISGPTGKTDERDVRKLRREVAQRIRAGDADSGPWRDAVFASTLASVRNKLAISNPRFVKENVHE